MVEMAPQRRVSASKRQRASCWTEAAVLPDAFYERSGLVAVARWQQAAKLELAGAHRLVKRP
jgi:hypothetical protein